MKLLYLYRNVITNIFTLFMLIGIIKGYPITRKDVRENEEHKDEKTYPNGTVVGKYSYKDNDGNPIHVKYYADDSGYGVELKSVKIFTSSAPETSRLSESKSKYSLKTDKEVESAPITTSPIYDHKSTSNPFEVLVKEDLKNSKFKYNNNPDYEIFLDNELKTPKKCGQEKVHVFYENNKRKSRNTLSEFDAFKYCEQMFT